MKRRGFALVSAIIIAAFLMTAVVGVSAVLTSQVRMQAQDGVVRKAFYYAEAALQEAFSAACNPSDTTGIRDKLAATTPKRYDGDAITSIVLNVLKSGDKRSFTLVKAKPVFDNKVLQRYEFVAMAVVSDRDLTGFTSTQLQTGSGYTALARRAIKLEASGLSAKDEGPAFDFGMFAGSGIIQTGNSSYSVPQPPDGSPKPHVAIYAGADATMKQTDLDSNISVAAHGSIEIGDAPGGELPHSRQLTISPINLADWQSQFVAFINGTAPYDGSDPTHMNTSSELVRAAISSILTAKTSNVAPSGYPTGYLFTTPTEVGNLWAALQPASPTDHFAALTIDQYQQLQNTFATTVFYVQDSVNSLNATASGGYEGVLVCPGTLTFEKNSVPGSIGAVFMSKGDLYFNGSGYFTGTFYTDGSFTHKGSTKGFYGSIIALKGDIDLRGASKAKFFLVNFAAGNTEIEEAFRAVEAIGSGWSEVDLAAFQNF